MCRLLSPPKGQKPPEFCTKHLPTEHLSEAISDFSVEVYDWLPNLFLAVKYPCQEDSLIYIPHIK